MSLLLLTLAIAAIVLGLYPEPVFQIRYSESILYKKGNGTIKNRAYLVHTALG